jgi:hypothetical protein
MKYLLPNRKLAESPFNLSDLPEEEEQNRSDFFGDVWLTVEETVGYRRDGKEPENQAHQSVEDNLFFQGSNRINLHLLLPLILGSKVSGRGTDQNTWSESRQYNNPFYFFYQGKFLLPSPGFFVDRRVEGCLSGVRFLPFSQNGYFQK